MFGKLFGKNKASKPHADAVPATPAVVHEVEGSAFSKRYVFDEPIPAETSGKNIVLRCAASYLPHPDKVSWDSSEGRGFSCQQSAEREETAAYLAPFLLLRHIETSE